jgi:hypothetical protein
MMGAGAATDQGRKPEPGFSTSTIDSITHVKD